MADEVKKELEESESVDAIKSLASDDAVVEEKPKPKPKRKTRSRKSKPKKVKVLKARGPKVINEHGTFVTGQVYEVSPEVAAYLVAVRGPHGEQYFEYAD